MEISELRDCTDERLTDLEQSLRRQLFDARIKNLTNQLDDTASIRRTRRDLARVKTVQSERVPSDAEHGGEAAPEAPEAETSEEQETE